MERESLSLLASFLPRIDLCRLTISRQVTDALYYRLLKRSILCRSLHLQTFPLKPAEVVGADDPFIGLCDENCGRHLS